MTAGFAAFATMVMGALGLSPEELKWGEPNGKSDVDKKTPENPYEGLSPNEIKQHLRDKYQGDFTNMTPEDRQLWGIYGLAGQGRINPSVGPFEFIGGVTSLAKLTVGLGRAGLRNIDDVIKNYKNNTKINFDTKILNQINKRGWSKDTIEQTIKNPFRIQKTKDTRWKKDGLGKNNEPATAYINKDGSYVVRNDKTGDIVQISDKNDPNWKVPF